MDLLNFINEKREFKRLTSLAKVKRQISQAHHFKIKTKTDVDNIKHFMKRDYKVCSNPLARYYKIPFAQWIAKSIRNTPLTPNIISITNILFFAVVFVILIFQGSYLSMILLAISVQIYHILDIVDGYLARLKNMKSHYGAWIDAVGDKFIFQLIFISISVSLFIKQSEPIYLILCIVFLSGLGLHSYSAYLTDRFYPGHIHKDRLKTKVKSMGFTKIFLFFLDNDTIYHMISFFALINKIGWLVVFYAVYFNLIWLSYVAYHSYNYSRQDSIN